MRNTRTSTSESWLGEALAAQKKDEAAEKLLIEGYEKMNPPKVNNNRNEQALARLVAFYEA